MKEEAFLGHHWEDIRLKIPKGKYRVVMLDFWDYTASVINDFDTLEEAMDFVDELKLMNGDPTIEFVVYDDRGEEIHMEEEGLDIPIPGVEDVFIHIKDEDYVAVAIFLDDKGEFEDLLFDKANSVEEAKDIARKLKNEHKDASRVIVINKNGDVLWEDE